MKPALRIIFLTLAFVGLAAAATPSRPILTKYQGLWNNSPFTSKPLVDPGTPEANALEGYSLLGVSPIAGGYRVTMVNTKNPTERVTVDSDKPSSDYKILAVIRNSGNPLGTTVRVAAGSSTNTVSFDEKQLTLASLKIEPQVQIGQAPTRQRIPRVIPPINPALRPTSGSTR